MKQTLYIIDAFTDTKFGGNPAGVMPLQQWLPAETMQQIAMENNQAETAFFVPMENGEFDLKWFTPVTEVNLCGHATLASAHVLHQFLGYTKSEIIFNSKSGKLYVTKNETGFTLNFPVDFFLDTEAPDKLLKALKHDPDEIYIGREDYLCVYHNEAMIRRIDPDFKLLAELKSRGVIVTAKGYETDFICRFFAPAFGIDEDPATGSIQTTLMPYWSKKLNKNELTSVQLSKRIGKFSSRLEDGRVLISGNAVTYLVGEIEI